MKPVRRTPNGLFALFFWALLLPQSGALRPGRGETAEGLCDDEQRKYPDLTNVSRHLNGTDPIYGR